MNGDQQKQEEGDRPGGPGKGEGKPPFIGTGILFWMVILFLFMVPFFFEGRDVERVSYSQFKEYLRGGAVEEVSVQGNEIQGMLREGPELEAAFFRTYLPPFEDPALVQLLDELNVRVEVQPEQAGWLLPVMLTWMPWLLLIAFFVYSQKRLQDRMGGGGGLGGSPFGLGASKARRFHKTSRNETFDDVAGLDNAKRDLREIVDYLHNPVKYQKIGAKLPRGILFEGPPGCGKTLLAKAMAGSAGAPFFSISGSEFIEMFVGMGASRVRSMFGEAKKAAPSIIFIDEIDSIGRTRGAGLGGGHDEREQTLNQILSEMDGFSLHESVVVIAATNRPDILDPALTRPGRFDRHISLDLPDRKAREKILAVHTQRVSLKETVSLESFAGRTPGLSGADLENLVNEASLLAARKNKDHVEEEDFESALDRVMLGSKRETILNMKEKRMVAYHESGHALVAFFLPESDPLEKVTIIPHGQALGATQQIPAEDRYNLTRKYLESRIAVMLAGREADKLVQNDMTTGAQQDLKQATQLARRMVCQWGMSDKIGPVTFRKGEEHVFLGRELAEQKDFSEYTARLIDEEVHHIMRGQEVTAARILSEKAPLLHKLAALLIEKEVLLKEEIQEVLSQRHLVNRAS